MPLPTPLIETRLDGQSPNRQGKVRDIFDAGDSLIMVATDRISAFDYVLGSGIPDKGRVLTQLSAFWFGETRHIVPNHLIATDVAAYPAALHRHADILAGRSMLVRKTSPVPVECVARGYLSGSGWKDYQATSTVCGVPLPPGLKESDRLPRPIFTPATKATSGHDVNISEEEAGRIVGPDLIARLRDLTLGLYAFGAAHAEARGIILADTKFEFGVLPSGEILLIDEVMTPDSSRYWPADQYAPGRGQASFDKQFVRDYLEQIRWNKQPPVPTLPDEVVRRTRDKYLEAFRRLTGHALEDGERGGSLMRERLERLVDEMVSRGIRYDDAQREFEKRFIAHVLLQADGNLCRAADLLGMHRNTLSRKIAEHRLRRSA